MLNRLWTDAMTKSSPREHRVVEIDPAILQDVGLDALEHPDALEPGIDVVDLVSLARQVVGLEPAGVRRGLAVIGDADVGVPGVATRERELLDGIGAVRVPGVAVQHAAEIARSSSRGSACRAAASTSPWPSRSSGGTKSRPSAA